jgi:hypothetical protein
MVQVVEHLPNKCSNPSTAKKIKIRFCEEKILSFWKVRDKEFIFMSEKGKRETHSKFLGMK